VLQREQAVRLGLLERDQPALCWFVAAAVGGQRVEVAVRKADTNLLESRGLAKLAAREALREALGELAVERGEQCEPALLRGFVGDDLLQVSDDLGDRAGVH